MKTKLKLILILISIAALCVVVSACSGNAAFDKYLNEGYSIVVTYDSNGGRFVGKEGNQIVDLYKPSNYTADETGMIHITLIEPTQRIITNEQVALTMSGYFVAGWYTERTIVKNDSGKVVDEDGVELKEVA